MAWQKKSTAEHKEVIDLKTGMHLIPLHDPETGAEWKVQIWVGPLECPTCGHCMPRSKENGTELDEIDVKKRVEEVIALLSQSHANVRKYARKHGVPVRGK